jgi:hypothetical protein
MSLAECAQQITPYGDGSDVTCLLLGLTGELGEALEEMNPVKEPLQLESELCDILVYLFLYHNVTGVPFIAPSMTLDDLAHGANEYAPEGDLTYALCSPILKLAEYEKKVNRGSFLRSDLVVGGLSSYIMMAVFRVACKYELNVGTRLSEVVEANRLRHVAGHYGKGETRDTNVIREHFRKIATGEDKRGSFLTVFAQSLIRADGGNIEVLLPACKVFMDKYSIPRT